MSDEVRAVLKEHYLAEIICDHETRQDKPGCWCSLVDLGWHPSVGEAVDAWVEHVMEQLSLRPGIDRPLRPGEENPWAKLAAAEQERDNARETSRLTDQQLDYLRGLLSQAEAVIEAAREVQAVRDIWDGWVPATLAAAKEGDFSRIEEWGEQGLATRTTLSNKALKTALAAYDRALSTTPRPTQAETLEFVRQRWPNRVEPIWRAAKCAEEAGECLGALNKPWLTPDDLRKETAQLAICVMALAESAGFDLNEAVAEEWAAASERTWPAALSTTPEEPE